MAITDMKRLKDLVKLMVDNDLTELELEGEGEKLHLKRASDNDVQYVSPPPQPAPAPAPQPAPAEAGGQAQAPAQESAGEAASDPAQTITSPMVGTFYAAASPDAEPFVQVGDRVGPDTVVCLIEAMKVFNEIKAEKAGVIEKVLVDNGQAIEYGEALFQIKPE
jgi:acetyl-CoA carboxylase biotin carboxyl carrier protein